MTKHHDPIADDVFIIGSPHPGSSIFTLAFEDVTGLPGFQGGQVVDIYDKLESVIDQRYRLHNGPIS